MGKERLGQLDINKSEIERKIPVEVYSRIVGYFRPVNQWNVGKQSEMKDRKYYSVERAKTRL